MIKQAITHIMNLAQTSPGRSLGVPEKTTPATAPPGYDRAVRLIAAWLDTFDKYNTQLTYGTAIGYPYTPSGLPRGQSTTPRSRLAWLTWCTEHNINPITTPRPDVEAWWNEVRANTEIAEKTRLLLARAMSAFSLWVVRNNHAKTNIGAWVDQTLLWYDTDEYRQRQA